MIPTKIYLNLLIILIALCICLLFYVIFLYQFQNQILKKGTIWYLIIIIVNLINIYYVMNFYEKNKFRKGKKGPKGNAGPRGLKGDNKICNSCGDAGKITLTYGGNINDNGKKIFDNKVVPGKCLFPFIDNFAYQYKCVKTKTPFSNKNDAQVFGWCPTKVDAQFNPITYAYCNENRSIQEKIRLNQEYRESRKNYLQNNSGIIDLKLVSGNSENDARKNMNNSSYDGYEFYERDLNKGTGGLFIYLCIKRGLKGQGISDIKLKKLQKDTGETETQAPSEQSDPDDPNDFTGYEELKSYNNGVSSRQDINAKAKQGNYKNELYLYIKRDNKNYIKDLQIRNLSEGSCTSLENGFITKIEDLNYGVTTLNTNSDDPLQLCISTQFNNIINIDSAFVYKDNLLYIFRGNKFFQMSSNPVSKALKVQDGFPKIISKKWGKVPKNLNIDNKNSLANNKSISDNCLEIKNEIECKASSNCLYDENTKKCENNVSYDAVFTYGFDNKTYFFRGNNVYRYNEKKMKIENGYPKNIDDVFKGVPENINAVFTWSKDGATYFFKGPFYYKYNDKLKKVERGYPKRSNTRWNNMPNIIDAIFSLPFSIEDGEKKSTTYVISGETSYKLDPINDSLTDEKKVDERFIGIDVSGITMQIETTSETQSPVSGL